MIEGTADRFVWSPPVTASSRAARKRVRTSSISLVAVAVVWAASSVWADGLDVIVFALVIPLMLAGIAVAIDRLFGVGEKLRIETAPEGLTIKRGRVRQLVPFTDITNVTVRSKAAGDRSPPGPAGWYVVIERAAGDSLSAIVPVGGGSAFDRDEARRLETELRDRCGVRPG